MKYDFTSDYNVIAHPMVLKALSTVGIKQIESYGMDEYSYKAAELIKQKINKPSADVYFIADGSLANLVSISSALRPHEAVISPETGRIYVYEAGTIEATGHKIYAVNDKNGKLSVDGIENTVSTSSDMSIAKPRIVYISLSTECGTVYSRAELSVISEYCRNNNLYLYLDGARIGAAINSPACDLSYSEIANLVDIFYIGGTRNGALFGEAIVICADDLKIDFKHLLRQKGATLAKGASIGIQFEALFKTDLYDELAKHSVEMAKKIADGIKTIGYDFLFPIEANLIFPILPTVVIEELRQLYSFINWQKINDKTAIRLVTSWVTTENIVEEFILDIKNITSKLKNTK